MDFCLDPSFHRVLESPGNYDFFTMKMWISREMKNGIGAKNNLCKVNQRMKHYLRYNGLFRGKSITPFLRISMENSR